MVKLSPNEGGVDRIVRIILGISIGALALSNYSPISQTAGLIVSAVLIITGATGFCGLYALLGISTCKKA